MKKALLSLAAMCTMGAVMAQTIVSTQTEKRNVILEEFTGYQCGYCPDGHYISNQICQEYEGHAWAINIHQGGYANGSAYTTKWGNDLASQYTIQGYPCGIVNRLNVANIQDRNQWAASAATVRGEDSPVNLAAIADLNEATRTFSIHLEVYYTADADQSTNFLNVVVLQNNVIGYQSNYGNFNPDFITPDGQYRHMHMLRDMITGQWGVEIPATKGSFLDTTITYTVPAMIENLAVDDLSDLEFVAFVTEKQTNGNKTTYKNILSGTKALVVTEKPQFSSLKNFRLEDCGLEYQLYATINNTTYDTINSVTINYDGTDYTIEKTILPFANDTVNIATYTITYATTGAVDLTTTRTAKMTGYTKNAGDESVDMNVEKSTTFGEYMLYNVNGPFTLRYGYDYYGSECSIEFLKQESCTATWTDGPWKDINWKPTRNIHYINEIPSATINVTTFSPAEAGLYILRFNDGYGDGWSFTNDDTTSGFWLSNADGEIAGESWGYSNARKFSVYDIFLNVLNDGDGSHTTGINDVQEVSFNIYPNPVHGQLSISASEPVRMVEVIDMSGRTVMTLGANTTRVNTESLLNGVYVIRVTTESGVGMQKFVKE